MKKILYITLFLMTNFYFSQNKNVGINTTTPTETLDVAGTMYTDKLFLRDPGAATQSGGGYLAATVSESKIGLYPTAASLFSYIPLKFTNVNESGIQDYDTKIPIDKFIVVLHNYAINTNSGSTAVALKHNVSNDLQGSPKFVAYKDVDGTKTWHIKGYFTNCKFHDTTGSSSRKFTINMYLMVYRYIISKQNIDPQTVVSGSSGVNGGSGIPAPTGF